LLNWQTLPIPTWELSRGQERIYVLVLTIILFGIQTSASIVIENAFTINFALSAVFSIFALFINFRRIHFRNYNPILLYLFFVFFVNLITLNQMYFTDYFLGPAQLIYSLFIAYSLYMLIVELNLAILRRWCLGLTTVIAVLSVLELNSSISAAFTGATQALTANINLANAFNVSDMRDLSLHGTVRSKVFATEPSHTALTLMALGFGFFWTKPNFKLIFIWIILVLICIWTIRSPIIAALLILAPTFLFTVSQNQKRIARLLIGILPLLLSGYFLSDYLLTMFGTRIETVGGGDGSFEMRFTVPFQFIVDFIPNHLLIGVGVVGDFDMLIYDILAAYYERGMSYIDYNSAAASISNNLAQHFISFGFFAGWLALAMLAFAARMRRALVWIVVCAQCLTIWMFLGGYVAARVWVLCALVLAVARRAEYEDNMVWNPNRNKSLID
jgi:hypothetical protein